MKPKVLITALICSGMLILSSCGKDSKKQASEEPPAFYKIEDMVINPAGTNGQRVMLVSLALQVKTAEDTTKLKDKSMLVKDVILTSLSGKTIGKLTQAGYKDSLKLELTSKLRSMMRKPEVKDIFFTKFIIQ